VTLLGDEHTPAHREKQPGANELKLQGKAAASVVGRYIRDAELFDDNAAAGIGL
jgi:hypothetical protein